MDNNEIVIEKRQLHNFKDSEGIKRSFGHLVIPEYQRRYDWKNDDIDSFMEEITNKGNLLYRNFGTFREKRGDMESILLDYANIYLSPKVYFGNIVITLVDESSKPNEVVDGQQRISTFAITMHLLTLYEEKIKLSPIFKANNNAFEPLFTKLNKLVQGSTNHGEKYMLISSKNKHDDKYLRDIFHINSFDSLTAKTKNRYIKNMFMINGKLSKMNGNELLFFMLALLTTEFGIVSFKGEERAFELFEALNSRGLQLSPSDLIKNYVFKLLHKSKENAEIL